MSQQAEVPNNCSNISSSSKIIAIDHEKLYPMKGSPEFDSALSRIKQIELINHKSTASSYIIINPQRRYFYTLYGPINNLGNERKEPVDVSFFVPHSGEVCGITLRVKVKSPSSIINKFSLLESVSFEANDIVVQALEIETIKKLDQIGIFPQDHLESVEYRYIKLPLYFTIDPQTKKSIFRHNLESVKSPETQNKSRIEKNQKAESLPQSLEKNLEPIGFPTELFPYHELLLRVKKISPLVEEVKIISYYTILDTEFEYKQRKA